MPNRYQNQPWYIRLWRRRWYLVIPYSAITSWWSQLCTHDPITFKHCWGIAIGLTHMQMKWYYTSEEVFEYEKEWNDASGD